MALKTREKLIEVARQLFVHKGLEKTTMNDIATASDRGRRTIYTYFKNKKEIYQAVLESESDHAVAALAKVVEDTSLPLPERLERMLTVRIYERQNTSVPYTTLRHLLKLDYRRVERIRRRVREKELQLLDTLLKQGIKEGIFDADMCARMRSFLPACLLGFESLTTTASDEHLRSLIPENAPENFARFIVNQVTITHTENKV